MAKMTVGEPEFRIIPLPREYYDLCDRLARLLDLMDGEMAPAVAQRAGEKRTWLIEEVQAVIDRTLGSRPCPFCQKMTPDTTHLDRWRVCVAHDLPILQFVTNAREKPGGPCGLFESPA